MVMMLAAALRRGTSLAAAAQPDIHVPAPTAPAKNDRQAPKAPQLVQAFQRRPQACSSRRAGSRSAPLIVSE